MSLLTSLDKGTYLLDSGYVKAAGTAIYLIVDKDRIVIYDTAHPDSKNLISAAIQEFGLTNDAVDYVVVSHLHLDHSGGAGHYANILPQAKFIVQPDMAKHLINPTKLIAGSKEIYGEEQFNKLYSSVLPLPADRIIAGNDGTKFKLGNRELEILWVSGHVYNHLALLDRVADCCHTGDAFGMQFPPSCGVNPVCRVICAPTQFVPELWQQTATKLSTLGVGRLSLAHFGILENDLAKSAEQVIDEIDDFVRFCKKIKQESERLDLLKQHIQQRWIKLLAPTEEPEIFNNDWAFKTDLLLASSGLNHWMQRSDKNQ